MQTPKPIRRRCFPTCLALIRKALVLAAGCLVIAGCKRHEPVINVDGTLVVTTLNNHRVTTWVNDEPVLDCNQVFAGYNKPLWLALPKGDCKLRFTAERLPGGAAEIVASRSPGGTNPGTTIVKLIKGSVFSPEDILTWTAGKDSDTSPQWTIHAATGWRPSLERFDDIGEVNDATKAEIAALLARLKAAFEAKDLSLAGWDKTKVEALLKEIGFPGSVDKDIFGADPYEVRVSELADVDIIRGKKTLLVHRHLDDEHMFYAGLAKSAPRENRKMYYSFMWDELWLVREKGKLTILWPEKQ